MRRREDYVYMIQLFPEEAPGLLKIGRSADPIDRAEAFRCVAPKLRILQYWRNPDDDNLEGVLRNRLCRNGLGRKVAGEVVFVDDAERARAFGDNFFFELSDDWDRIESLATVSHCTPEEVSSILGVSDD